MKTLYLLRHAKSSWDAEETDDHDRPLDPRGQRAATLMGAYLEQRVATPQRVLCSTATRARQTLERVQRFLTIPPAVEFDEGLYLASHSHLLERLTGVDDAVTGVLMIGHNPGIHQLARALGRRGKGSLLRELEQGFTTAALASIELPTESWADLPAIHGTLQDFAFPKMLV